MRRFNVSGLCVPEEDYMVDISGKLEQIIKLMMLFCSFYGTNRCCLPPNRADDIRWRFLSVSFKEKKLLLNGMKGCCLWRIKILNGKKHGITNIFYLFILRKRVDNYENSN